MANNILQQLAQMQQGASTGNNAMLQQLINFKKTYRGDPRQAVMQMLQSGQIDNNQLQRAMEQAKQLSKLLR